VPSWRLRPEGGGNVRDRVRKRRNGCVVEWEIKLQLQKNIGIHGGCGRPRC
jgi:hypothetical protein